MLKLIHKILCYLNIHSFVYCDKDKRYCKYCGLSQEKWCGISWEFCIDGEPFDYNNYRSLTR